MSFAACGGNTVRDDAPPAGSVSIPELPGDAVPRPESRSRYGNGPVYEVLGKRYRVLDSSAGYQERGVASWYGTKFHGNLTSSREPYDMYEMTAAHKTLPLPTYARVRNLRNDRSVVVRINDRGPFVHNRIIDLSYAAALKLDMVKDGTSLVEVTAISFDEPAGDRPVRKATPSAPPPEVDRASAPAAATANRVFVQVGAFGDRANAERRLTELSLAGVGGARIHEEPGPDRVLYRVRVGPVADVVQYDVLIKELEILGITDPYLITD
jgi:rare lipoprotein A